MNLLNRARAASGTLHREIEETPLARALAGATVDRETYVRLQRALYDIHLDVEGELAQPPLSALEVHRYRRAETVAADLRILDPAGEFPSEDTGEDGRWSAAMAARADDSAWVWVGALYVLEGSKMGSRMLCHTIAKALNVPAEAGHGIDYHLAGVADRGQSWNLFKAFLESATVSDAEADAFADGVALTFQLMVDVYAGLSSVAVN